MRVLLHICCGPCATYPFLVLEEEGMEVDGLFYNPNIHPYREHQARLEAARSLAEQSGRRLLVPDGYELKEFFQKITFREDQRCLLCYQMRLNRTARIAARGGYDAFSTTLLLSIYQDQELIRQIGAAEGAEAGVKFLDRDFRSGWKEHWALTEQYGLYKQQYCGCIYSEWERFSPPSAKK